MKLIELKYQEMDMYYKGRVMLIFEDVMFPLWNHLFLCYPCHADFKTALVFKIGPILVVDVNF